MEKRKIMVVVDSRATWSRAKTVCEEIQKREDLELQLGVVGPLFHQVWREGHIDGFVPVWVHKPLGLSMSQELSHYVAGLSAQFEHGQPDVAVSVTDRYESLATATAAFLSNVHVAHIQGGEVSGSHDDSMRHAITKLSHIHFPANQDSADRIRKLGEDPRFIFNVGCPATDLLLKVNVSRRDESWPDPYILVSFNSVTTQTPEENKWQATWLLEACRESGIDTLFIPPNHDCGSYEIQEVATKLFCEVGQNWLAAYPSVPHSEFINLMAHASALVGNSSSGIREACYFGTPVVNTGDRQLFRSCTKNVLTIHDPTKDKIKSAIEAQLEHGKFEIERPYGNGGAGKKIAEILATIDLPPIQKYICY